MLPCHICCPALLQVEEGDKIAAALRGAEKERDKSKVDAEDARAALQSLQVFSLQQ